MAITKIDFPTASTAGYTPSISTDYNNQNEYIERNARGYNAISLTNWDTSTAKPQIAAGSVIEINGASWDITTDTDISTTGASSGTVYIVFDDATPEFKFTSTAPTWSATLNGWYVSGDRATGHVMTWDGSSSYSGKGVFSLDRKRDSLVVMTVDGDINGVTNINASGNIDVDTINTTTASNWTGTYGTKAMSSGADWIIPAGGYMMCYTGQAQRLQVKDAGSTWIVAGGAVSGFVVSDGINYRLHATGAGDVYYRKIW